MPSRDPYTTPNVPAAVPTRNELCMRPPDVLWTLPEASVYVSAAERTIVNAVRRGELEPDARGGDRSPMFLRGTLDAWLASRRRS